MPLREPAWTFEYTIDCGVTPEFAWNFWTKVSNWVLDADVDSIEIDGRSSRVQRVSRTASVLAE